jgi:hypothetical protein
MEVRLYRERPTSQRHSKQPAQAVWEFLRQSAAPA